MNSYLVFTLLPNLKGLAAALLAFSVLSLIFAVAFIFISFYNKYGYEGDLRYKTYLSENQVKNIHEDIATCNKYIANSIKVVKRLLLFIVFPLCLTCIFLPSDTQLQKILVVNYVADIKESKNIIE